VPLQWSRYTALLFAVELGIGTMLVIAALGVVTSFLALRGSKI
jgi:hypothetical protein